VRELNACVRFKVLTTAIMKMTVFRKMEAVRTFEAPNISIRLHGATSQKTVIFWIYLA
jgi:hypothetical protein